MNFARVCGVCVRECIMRVSFPYRLDWFTDMQSSI